MINYERCKLSLIIVMSCVNVKSLDFYKGFGLMYKTYLSKLEFFLVVQEIWGPTCYKQNCSFSPQLGWYTIPVELP